MLTIKHFLITSFVVIACISHAEDTKLVGKPDGTPIIVEFPWELLVDRGKIHGCIYENAFFSVGSILIEDSLPRKCHIDTNRDGYWSVLDERELELFERALEQDAPGTMLDDEPLDRLERSIIKRLRQAEKTD